MNRLREENITFGSRDQETSLIARIKPGLCIHILTTEKTDTGCTCSSGVYAKMQSHCIGKKNGCSYNRWKL